MKTLVKTYYGLLNGSPWEYDTHVPIIFSGPGIDELRVDRLIHPADIVPTLSSYLKLSIPETSTGTILREINK